MDKVVIIGILIYSKGSFDEVIIVKMSGNSSMNLILKNIVRLMISLVIISVYCMCFLLNVLMSVVVMCCVVLVLEINFFSIVLKLRIMVSLFRVLLILFCMECRMFCVFIFLVNFIMVVIRIRVIKLLILKLIIKINSSVMFVVIIINGIFVFFISVKIVVFMCCVVFFWLDGN